MSPKKQGEVDRKEETEGSLKLLRGVPIFYRLDDDALKSLLEIAKQITYAPNAKIVEEGGRGSELHLVLKGQVEVRKKGKEIAKLGRGQFFGEMVFLDDLPGKRTADVVALEETSCLAIPGWSWYSYLRQHPDVAIEVIRTLAHRLREAIEEKSD
ncbi:MAG TPA: cyclic nucleotide-binding domain-containing protein [Nitrososphaerales archaeon]|nr:cyclic nucleotide-binding domain-containing protein [Nitrososphaerales archaeon]